MSQLWPVRCGGSGAEISAYHVAGRVQGRPPRTRNNSAAAFVHSGVLIKLYQILTQSLASCRKRTLRQSDSSVFPLLLRYVGIPDLSICLDVCWFDRLSLQRCFDRELRLLQAQVRSRNNPVGIRST